VKTNHGPSEARGVLMVLAATLAWSFAGVFTRALTIDAFTTVAWRSLAGGLLLLVIWLAQRRSRALYDLRALRGADWIAVGLGVIAQGAFSASLFFTSVSHVAVIYALTPFLAAILAWRWLGEPLRTSTLIALCLAVAGAIAAATGSLDRGMAGGDALVFVTACAFGTLIVYPRVHPELKVAESTFISAFATFALFAPFSHTADLNTRNLMLVYGYGCVNLVFAYYLFVSGARLVPSVTAGLIITLENAFSPFWVWLIMGETVDRATLFGGALVLCAVTGHLIYSTQSPDDGEALYTDARNTPDQVPRRRL
jgi:drug/metabolite transporter (DMT)-like permease